MTQNEPDCACNFGNAWNPGQTAAFVDVLGPKLHALSPPVKLLSPETAFPPDNFNNFVSAIESDSTANAQTDIFSTHQYGNIIGITNDGSHHIWETEVFDGGSWDPSIAEALNVQSLMYDSVVTSGLSAWNYWNIVCGSGCSNNGLTGDFSGGSLSELPKRYYAVGNWSRYVRPGWVRIGVSGSLGGIFPVAFKDPISGKFAIIAINNSGSDIQNITFGVSGASVTGSVTPYITSGTPIGALGSDGNLSAGSASSNVPASLPVSGNVWTATVPYGVTTFVGGP
jgi:glucuronoarabinoxylan endo-1,4-beta-xylanase